MEVNRLGSDGQTISVSVMADAREIEQLRKTYSSHTDFDLIKITYEMIPSCANHIAAKQLLEERRAKVELNRHMVIEGKLSALKDPHWTVKPTFWLTFISAIAAVLAAWFAWLPLQKLDPPPQPIVNALPQSSPSTLVPASAPLPKERSATPASVPVQPSPIRDAVSAPVRQSPIPTEQKPK